MSDARWRAARAGQTAQLAERRHDVGRGLVERQAVVLGHVAESGPHADGVVRHVDAAYLDPSGSGAGETEQEPERRCLPRAVGADQADTPAGHVDRQVVERGNPRVALGETLDTKDRSGIHDSMSLSAAAPRTRVR